MGYFHLVCNVEGNVKDFDALSLNYWLAKFIQEVVNKKVCRYPLRTLYGMACDLKRHLAIYKKE